MPKQATRQIARTFAFSALVLLAVSCRQVVDVPTVSFADYGQRDKIRLHVDLRLSEDLQQAQSERTHESRFVIPLGQNLVVNVELLARAVFTDVSVSKDTTRAPIEQASAILVPRMISSERVAPKSAYIKQAMKMAVILEWTLKDAENNTVWVDTITAEGKASEWTLTEEARKELIETLVRDLFSKSYDAMSSSPEIRNFAAGRTGKVKN